MTRYYCSLADKNYVVKLLCLYDSLLRHSSADFCLYILALDKETRDTLVSLGLKSAIIVESWHFEKEMDLAGIKASRTWQEWAWTCASQFCEFIMRSGLREITYLDADTFMFSDPEAAFPKMGERSIGITPHRFIPAKQYLEATSGKFNVGWLTFRNTPIGFKCLAKWAARVREQCSAEVGCGDQLYLDSFPAEYGDELCWLGINVNVAPWNVGNWTLTEGPCVDGIPIISFHVHELGEREDGSLRLTNYELRPEDVSLIYAPYLSEYARAKERIAGVYVS